MKEIEALKNINQLKDDKIGALENQNQLKEG